MTISFVEYGSGIIKLKQTKLFVASENNDKNENGTDKGVRENNERTFFFCVFFLLKKLFRSCVNAYYYHICQATTPLHK